MMTWHKYDGL